jgi:hypothetical protein
MTFSTEIKKNPKIHMESQDTQIVKAILSKKNKSIVIKFPDFYYYVTFVIKAIRD